MLIYSGLSCMLTMSVLPASTFAESMKPMHQLVQEKAVTDNELSTSFVLLQTYALTLLKQPAIPVNDMPSLIIHIQNAKQAANEWIEIFQPKYLHANQGIISLNEDVESYYDTLLELADGFKNNKQTKADFIRGIEYLQSSLKAAQSRIQDTIQNTTDFSTITTKELTSFSVDAQKGISKLSTSDSEAQSNIEILLRKIYENRDFAIQAELKRMYDFVVFVNSVEDGKNLGTIFTNIVNNIQTSEEVKNKLAEIISFQNKIYEWQGKLSTNAFNLARVKDTEQNLKNFVPAIDIGKKSLEALQNELQNLNQHLVNIKNISNDAYADSEIIKEQLTEFKKRINVMNTNAKKQEDSITKIHYQE